MHGFEAVRPDGLHMPQHPSNTSGVYHACSLAVWLLARLTRGFCAKLTGAVARSLDVLWTSWGVEGSPCMCQLTKSCRTGCVNHIKHGVCLHVALLVHIPSLRLPPNVLPGAVQLGRLSCVRCVCVLLRCTRCWISQVTVGRLWCPSNSYPGNRLHVGVHACSTSTLAHLRCSRVVHVRCGC